ncbi:uncharacterized protein LOC127836466 [Dreissena polymorpha]|uniref:Uncharacterized protein n=1 Tax=Dreissena polymorpha TaxID=45954 RepID=A0A9D4GEF1_DREPO|nr:uncharacterized protein LOC127836466 [Dreissena polymorpha]KAH3815605.1 hypothetical protein DPMN_144133 [Dreissena polymorpha]
MFTRDGLHLNASGARGCLETVLDDMQPVTDVHQIEAEPVVLDCVWTPVSTPAMVSDANTKSYADVVRMAPAASAVIKPLQKTSLHPKITKKMVVVCKKRKRQLRPILGRKEMSDSNQYEGLYSCRTCLDRCSGGEGFKYLWNIPEEEERSGTTLQTEEPTRMSSFIDKAEKEGAHFVSRIQGCLHQRRRFAEPLLQSPHQATGDWKRE